MALLSLLGAPLPASAITAYALTTANQLLVFDTVAPGTILSTVTITGLQPGETIQAIDFRPLDGQLYGVGSTSRLYRIHFTGSQGSRLYSLSPLLDDLLRLVFEADFHGVQMLGDVGVNVESVEVISDLHPAREPERHRDGARHDRVSEG